MSWWEAAARWYGVLLLLTWGWAPLVRLLCPRLADRGMLVARPLALLGVVYPSWLAAGSGLLPYSTAGLWGTLAVGSVLGWGVALRRGLVDRGWLRSLLAAEAVSLAVFAAYLAMRGYTPWIYGTEKPMDVAFLASSSLTATIPPPDPWFAGEPINYYYLGYLLHGALARLAGVVPTTAFNLALATTCSMAATAAVGLGYDAVRPWFARRRAVVAGALAAVLLLVAGNLYAAGQLAKSPTATVDAWWWDQQAGIGWRASRIVCDGPRVANECPASGGRTVETINEFPFFSLLLGDLHPHLMALPFTVVALVLALNLLPTGRRWAAPGRGEWGRVVATGAVVGGLYALNSWDVPTYLLVAAVALWVGWGMRERSTGRRRGRGVALLLLVASAAAAWLPFALRFVPPMGGSGAVAGPLGAAPLLGSIVASFGVHSGERTSVGEYLTVFGLPYLFGVWLVGSGLLARREPPPPRSRAVGSPSRAAIVFGVLVVAIAVVLPAPILILCGVPLAAAVGLLRRDGSPSPRTLATALFALGWFLSIVVELFYLRDVFDSRMNTLFKVYYQIWTLLAVTSAVAIVVIWREARPRWAARPAVMAVAAAGLAAAAVYPAVATRQWAGEAAGWSGLDGIAYLAEEAPSEAAAIRWLQGAAEPGDVVLEVAGCGYPAHGEVPLNRVSAYTGVPSIIGWGRSHQTQWRDGQPDLLAQVPERQETVSRLLAVPTGAALDRYGIEWLFLGRYERDVPDGACSEGVPGDRWDDRDYPGAGWELAFGDGEVRVFRRAATEPAVAGDASP